MVEDINENRDIISLDQYDTILIDEAQDFKAWQYDFCKLSLKSN